MHSSGGVFFSAVSSDAERTLLRGEKLPEVRVEFVELIQVVCDIFVARAGGGFGEQLRIVDHGNFLLLPGQIIGHLIPGAVIASGTDRKFISGAAAAGPGGEFAFVGIERVVQIFALGEIGERQFAPLDPAAHLFVHRRNRRWNGSSPRDFRAAPVMLTTPSRPSSA